MKFYLAGRYSSHPEMREIKKELVSFGHTVTSRWISGDHESKEGREHTASNQLFAREDLEDIDNANAVIWFSCPQNDGRGGRHVEFGYAIAIRTQIFVIGRRENVFHWLDADMIRHFDDWADFKQFLFSEIRVNQGLTSNGDVPD